MGVHGRGAHGVDLQSGRAGTHALDQVAVQGVADSQNVPLAGRGVPRQASLAVGEFCKIDRAAALPDIVGQVFNLTWFSDLLRARSALRHRAPQHGDIAIEAFGLLRLRQADADMRRPLEDGRGGDEFLGGVLRSHPRAARVPATAQIHAQFDAQAAGLADGMSVEFPPLGTHEVRSSRRVGPRFAGVEQQGPGDPLFLHLREIAADALLARRAVEPPPVAPGFCGIRRRDEIPPQIFFGRMGARCKQSQEQQRHEDCISGHASGLRSNDIRRTDRQSIPPIWQRVV